MSRLHSLAYIAAFFLLVALLLCGGCAAPVTPQSIAAGGGTATGQLQGAKADVTAAMSHADQYGKGLLTSAETAIAHVLTTELPALEAAGPALQREIDSHQSDLKRDKWIGWEVRHILYWLIGIAAGIMVLQLVCLTLYHINILGFAAPALSAVGQFFGMLIPVFGTALNWLHQHLVKKAEVKTAVTNTMLLPAGTLPPAPTPEQLKVLATPQPPDPLEHPVAKLARKLKVSPPAIGSTVPHPFVAP